MSEEQHNAIDDYFPTECVLCDYAGETTEEYEQHMEEVHDE